MKKIMFNEHYGLETATLNGSKTRTSRIITVNSIYEKFIDCLNRDSEVEYEHDRFVIYNTDGRYYTYRTRYLIGDIIAISQRYKDVFPNADFEMVGGKFITESAGWNNKMFVKAELMPHQIQITDIKLERLQDISDEDCIKEGIIKGDFTNTWDEYYYDIYGDCRDQCHKTFKTPKEAFADLIDKVSGKGTWRKNPWVVVYYYQLIK